jgi:hypothetical protein
VRLLGGNQRAPDGASLMRSRYFVVASLLVILGVLGFTMADPLFGVFEVTPIANAIHVLAGICAALAATRGIGSMRMWGQILGFMFLALSITAFATDAAFVSNALPLTDNHAWLHLALACVFLYHAFLAPPTI